jgi:hypothetical protein
MSTRPPIRWSVTVADICRVTIATVLVIALIHFW